MQLLVLPPVMDAQACLEFSINAPSLYTEAEDVVIDLSTLRWSFPLGMLVVGAAIRRLHSVRKQFGLSTALGGIDLTSNQCQSYIAHLGFFHWVGLDIGTPVGEASGNSRYLPIRSISVADLRPKLDNWSEVASKVDEEATSLARVLVGRENNSDFRAVSYILREALRNAVEHSGADECYFCAQRWRDGRVQIAILDEGSGIKSTLDGTYENLGSHSDAIRLAVQPGVSRIFNKPESYNLHGNSGYGLYVLSELGKSFGYFALASGDTCYHLNKAGEQHRRASHSGTFLGLHFSSPPTNFVALLDDIIAAGEGEAAAAGRISNASTHSKSTRIE